MRFGSQAGTLIVDPTAVFDGAVVANAAVNDVLQLGGSGAGTFAGLGSQFTGFSTLTEDAGSSWTLAGSNAFGGTAAIDGALTIASSLSLTGTTGVAEALTLTGSLTLGQNATLSATTAGGSAVYGSGIGVDLTNGGNIFGGVSGVGDGGRALRAVAVSNGASFTNNGTVTGAGGLGGDQKGGAGGDGAGAFSGATINNDGTIIGGLGGSGSSAGGVGETGARLRLPRRSAGRRQRRRALRFFRDAAESRAGHGRAAGRVVLPLIPVDLLRIKLFALSVVTSICSFSAYMLVFLAMPFLLQVTSGRDQVATGLLMTPWPVALGIIAPIAGRLADRFPAAIIGSVGLALLCVGLFALAKLPPTAPAAVIAGLMALCGLGFGLFQAPNNRTLLSSAPRARAGAAGGMLAVSRLLGMTVGATLAAIYFRLAGASAETFDLFTAAASMPALATSRSIG